MTEAETILESIPGVKVFKPTSGDIVADYEKLVTEVTNAIKPLAEIEREYILQVVEVLGNKTKAAKALGISVKGLYNRLHSFGYEFKNNDK